jgi:hypothetical protein
MWHCVLAKEDANRMSVQAFYNPLSDAEAYPSPQLMITLAEQNGISRLEFQSFANKSSNFAINDYFAHLFLRLIVVGHAPRQQPQLYTGG